MDQVGYAISLLFVLVSMLCSTLETSAFQTHSTSTANGSAAIQRQIHARCEMANGNFFDDIKRFFGDGNNENNGDGQGYGDDNLPAGTTRIATIPVRSIKPGGLRLFLMFYFMGMRNTPDKNSWRADQPTTEDYVIEMYFHDASAMLTVELMEDEIRIDRTGSLPSTQYLMQESIVVQGVLDELQQCSSDDEVPEEHRLLIPEPENAIEAARDTLSFG